ncbi:MAG: hypothetical protein QM756_38630 [Polyangiaceae bacterium]
MVARGATAAGVVYARGDDGRIYTYQHAFSTSTGLVSLPWRQVSGVDSSALVAGAELDCDGYPITHIAAIASTPKNSVVHSSGTDATFSAFYNTGIYAEPTSLSANTPGIYTGGAQSADVYSIALTTIGSTSFTIYSVDTGTVKTRGPSLTKSLASGTENNDIWQVSYTSDGFMLLVSEWYNMGFTGWNPEEYISPPTGTTFQYSPTVCGGSVFATAGNRLWRLAIGSSAWVKVSDTSIVSSPDCNGNSMAVATTAAGGVLFAYYVENTTGPAAQGAIDLGVY